MALTIEKRRRVKWLRASLFSRRETLRRKRARIAEIEEEVQAFEAELKALVAERDGVNASTTD